MTKEKFRFVIKGIIYSLIITLIFIILYLVKNYYQFGKLEIAPTFPFSLFIGIAGLTFAIIASLEARGALNQSEEIIRIIGSFHMDFSDIIEELHHSIAESSNEFKLFIPTSAYGYLFQEKKASMEFISELEKKLNVILKDLDQKESSPSNLQIIFLGSEVQQIYLKRAVEMDLFQEYSDLTNTTLNKIKQIQEKIIKNGNKNIELTIKILDQDPHIRIFLYNENIDGEKKKIAKVWFAQTEIKNQQFEASGFSSERPEMVRAIDMLFNLYSNDSKLIQFDIDNIKDFIKLK